MTLYHLFRKMMYDEIGPAHPQWQGRPAGSKTPAVPASLKIYNHHIEGFMILALIDEHGNRHCFTIDKSKIDTDERPYNIPRTSIQTRELWEEKSDDTMEA